MEKREITVAAAQMGPVSRSDTRRDVVERLIHLMRQAKEGGCDLVVYPEAALTPFFPHWLIEDPDEINAYCEREMPGPETQPLFDEAARLQVGFYLGYAELAEEDGVTHRYNSSVLVGPDGGVIGRFRKIHLPGYSSYQPDQPFQNLEKMYFEVGNLGFGVWDAFGGRVGMCICNDRRWPETYRVMGLQGAELILTGYNTPAHNPAFPENDPLCDFHNHLSMQAGAYQNGTWVVGVAKAGIEEGVSQIGKSCIIAPSGEIVAVTSTLGDELITATCDLEKARFIREKVLNLRANRRVEYYGRITEVTE